MLTREFILTTLKQQKVHLQQQFGITQIALFGSWLRNEATLDSDIDLLIDLSKATNNLLTKIRVKSYLEELFQCPIDLVILTTVKKCRKAWRDDIIHLAEFV